MIYFYPESPNEGGVFNTYHEPLSPNVEPLSPIERGTFKIQDDPELPNKGACFRYMVNRNHQIRGVLQIYGSRYQMRGACLRYRMSRYRQLRGACSRYRMTRIHQVFRYMEYRNRQMRGPWFEIYDESKSAKEGAC